LILGSNKEVSGAASPSAEMSNLRREATKLQDELARKEDLLRQTTTALKERESSWQAHTQEEEKQQSTKDMASSLVADDKITKLLAQVDFQKRQSETYLQQLRDPKNENAQLSHQLADSSTRQVDIASLDQLKADVNEARRLADFFKKNSEQTSKTNRELSSVKRALEETVANKTKEADDQNSLILKMQLGDMPRAYYQY
jgi:chromosome segregation ATPase